MATWTSPVFDRTQLDVDYAKQKIAEWVALAASGETPPVSDLKGCLNVSDMNRIEENVKYLSEELLKYNYPNSVHTKTWSHDGLPNETNVERIKNNVLSLLDAFYKHEDAPYVPNRMLWYQDVNDIEKNLYLIKVLLDEMVKSFKHSGTFYAGSTIRLPMGR